MTAPFMSLASLFIDRFLQPFPLFPNPLDDTAKIITDLVEFAGFETAAARNTML